VFIVFSKSLIAACFCSEGWHESLGIITSVAVGFRKMLHEKLFSLLLMVMSRKLILLSVSFSIVNLTVGARLLLRECEPKEVPLDCTITPP
jgi:hypothetical protein